MKRFLPVLYAVLATSLLLSAQSTASKKSAREFTVADVRALLVGKKVVVKGRIYQASRSRSYIMNWQLVTKEGDVYKVADSLADNELPITFQGQEAEVIAVQLNRIERERANIGKPNALGEVHGETTIVNPYCDVVVRFADGTIAMTTNYPATLFNSSAGSFQLASERREQESLIAAQLPSIVGKVVYAVGYSRVYPVSAGIDDLIDGARYSSKRVRGSELPRLKPLTITAAKYNAEKAVIVLKLKGPDGAEYLAASDFGTNEAGYSFLKRVAHSSPASLYTEITGLTPKEVEAVREGSIVTGMSRRALYYAVGFPEKENDWGRGGKQLIYYGGRVMVYMDSSNRVQDWQNIDR